MDITDTRIARFQAALNTAAKIRAELETDGITIEDRYIVSTLQKADIAKNGHATVDGGVVKPAPVAPHSQQAVSDLVAVQGTWFRRILAVLSFADKQKTRQIAETLRSVNPSFAAMDANNARDKVYAELARMHKKQKDQRPFEAGETHVKVRQGRWSITEAGRKALADDD